MNLNPKDVRVDRSAGGILSQFAARHIPTGITIHGGSEASVLSTLEKAVASAGWKEEGHAYVSTACLHGLHSRCIRSCKFCEAPCGCGCDHSIGSDIELVEHLADALKDLDGHHEIARRVVGELRRLPRSK